MKLSKLLVCALFLFSMLTTSTDAIALQAEAVKLAVIAGKCVITSLTSGQILGIVTGFWGVLLNTATCTGIGYLQYSGPQGYIAIIKDVFFDTGVSVVSGGMFHTKNISILGKTGKFSTLLTKATRKIGNYVSKQTAQKISAETSKHVAKIVSKVQIHYSNAIISASVDALVSKNARVLAKNIKF